MVTHAEMVKKLAKPGNVIASEMQQNELDLLKECSSNLVAAGEITDKAKKIVIYRKGAVPEDPRPIQDEIDGTQANILHMAVGIAGEAAELLDAVLKHLDGERLDVENCIEELGDIEFYAEGFRQGLGLTRGEILDANIEKLSVRYNGLNYSDQQAQDRADKN